VNLTWSLVALVIAYVVLDIFLPALAHYVFDCWDTGDLFGFRRILDCPIDARRVAAHQALTKLVGGQTTRCLASVITMRASWSHVSISSAMPCLVLLLSVHAASVSFAADCFASASSLFFASLSHAAEHAQQ
jgi:hypothetical protein